MGTGVTLVTNTEKKRNILHEFVLQKKKEKKKKRHDVVIHTKVEKKQPNCMMLGAVQISDDS